MRNHTKGNTYVVLIIIALLASTATADWRDWFRSKPKLTEEQRQWKLYNYATPYSGNIGDFDFSVFSHGYKFIETYRTEPRKTKSREIPAEDKVIWGWKLTLENKSKESFDLSVEYLLYDEDGFIVARDEFPAGWIGPGKRKTIQKKSSMSMTFDDIGKVAYSSWEISFGIGSLFRN